MQNNGIIQSFEEKKAFLFVRLKKTYWKTRNKPLKSFIGVSKIKILPKKHTIKYKELLKLKYKESEIILNIINTDKGIISDKEVLQNYSGGFPIIKIV